MKIEKYVLAFAAVALLSGAVLAAPPASVPPQASAKAEEKAPPKHHDKAPMKAMPDQKGPRKAAAANYKISFKIAAGGVENSATVTVLDGVQVNYNADKEIPVETADETGKKTVTDSKRAKYVANFLPVSDPAHPGFAMVQAQFEMSTSNKKGRFIMVQLQTEFRAEKGKPVVLVEDSDKHIEVLVEDAQ